MSGLVRREPQRPSQTLGRRAAGRLGTVVTATAATSAALTFLMPSPAVAAVAVALAGITATVLVRWLLEVSLQPLDVLQTSLLGLGADEPQGLPAAEAAALGGLADAFDATYERSERHRSQAMNAAQEAIDTQREIIHLLGEAVENRSDETGSHTARVGHAAALLASLAGLDDTEAEILRLAAPMHDVGKIGIPDSILHKPGSLTREEIEIMKTHTTIGHEILVRSDRPILQAAAAIAHDHHERWDGTGYPRGLERGEIHLYGRITSIVDCFDALTSNRVYRCALDADKTFEFMKAQSGKAFDPALLEIFVANAERFTLLMQKFDRSPVDLGDHTELTV